MKQLRVHFKIISDNHCPLYDEGEILFLSEKTFSCPENKETCLILVREVTNILFELLDSGSAQGPAWDKVYNCSGCTGLIKFSRISEQDAIQDLVIVPELPMGKDEELLLSRVRDFPFMAAIPVPDHPQVLRSFHEETLSKDVTLIHKGQGTHFLYLILEGDVVVSDSALVIASLGPGDIFGEMSYLGGDKAAADVRTLTETNVLVISGEHFSVLLDRIPGLQVYMSKILVRRLTAANATHFATFDACMSGRISEMPPAELFQIFHMNQKTGLLAMEFPGGEAKVSFREGCVINAQYLDLTNQKAIFAMLKEKDGRYIFTSGLSPEDMKAAEIGDFMMLLMEGIKRVDESCEGE